MTTPITEYVQVTVTIADRLIQALNFGIPAIFDEFVEPTAWETGQRTADYADLTALGVDFATTTKVYKAAVALFTKDSNFPAPSTVKVLRQDSGDSDITAALNAIDLVDSGYYALIAANRLEADILEIAAWVQSASALHIYFACSEDSGIIDSGDSTDVASDLQGFAYTRISLLYHHNGGVDASAVSITVATLIATVTQAAHGLRVGDLVTVSGASGSDLNGNKTVATVPTSGTWTFTTTEGDGADANNGSIAYFARYAFPEAREVGMGIPTTPGEITWFAKELTGQTPTPTTLLNLTQQRTARGKGANIYTSIGGLGALQEGVVSSGRFIDNQIGADWIGVRIAEIVNQRLLTSKKVPYTDAGFAVIYADINAVLTQGLTNGLLADRLVGDTKGQSWIIFIPQLEDIPSADRVLRNLPGIIVTVRFAGAVHNVEIAVNVEL